MQTFLSLYGLGLVSFLIIDILWVGFVANGFYARHIGYLLGEVRWGAAILFYLLFMLGFTYFVTYPLVNEPMLKIVLTGAFFGLVAYATYDLTSQALIRDWPVIVTVVDMAWGATLSGLVALSAVGLYRLIG